MDTSLSGVVVGAGSIGQRHVENLLEVGVDELSIVETNSQTRRDVIDRFGVDGYETLDGALAQKPDFAVIATPTVDHVPSAISAAEAGCHLFVEKPLSDSDENIPALRDLVAEQNLTTLVGCNLRFHPALRKIKDLLDTGTIGTVLSARIEGGSYLPEWYPDSDYRQSYSARSELGGGVILDYIHEINYARWFFDEFTTVSAIAGQYSSLEVDVNDIAGILAESDSGMLCEFHLDYVQQPYSRTCHIIGEDGTIRWDWQRGSVEWQTASTQEWRIFELPSDWDTNEMYLEEIEHFIRCVDEDIETTCPISCGYEDVRVALAARRSAESGEHIYIDDSTPG